MGECTWKVEEREDWESRSLSFLSHSELTRVYVAYSLLLNPMQFLPALDGALEELVVAIHQPAKHDIVGKNCESILLRRPKFFVRETR